MDLFITTAAVVQSSVAEGKISATRVRTTTTEVKPTAKMLKTSAFWSQATAIHSYFFGLEITLGSLSTKREKANFLTDR